MNQLQISIIIVLTLIIALILTWIYIKYGKQWFKKHKATVSSTVVLAIVGTLLFAASLVSEGDDDANITWYTSSGRNGYFTTNTSVHFSQILINDDYIQFNTTKIQVDAPSRINITMMYLNPQLTLGDADEEMLDFYADIASGTVWFNISGFQPMYDYDMYRGGAKIETITANAAGWVNFSNVVWSEQHFEIKKSDEPKWHYYYGDASGTNFEIHTYDVVKVYLNDGAGTEIFNMTGNPDITYNVPRTVTLTHEADGVNYTAFTNETSITLSAVNATIGLVSGYYLALWNETTFTWNFWISHFPYNNNKNIHQYNVIFTKIAANQGWDM